MAILRAKRAAAILGTVGLAYLAGCILVDALKHEERPFAFSHRLHTEEQNLECSDCHARWDDAEDPDMPRAAQCALCHAKLDAEKPPELRVATLFDDAGYRAANAGRQSEEVLYSHQQHATRSTTLSTPAKPEEVSASCLSCHAEVAHDDGTLAQRGSELRMSMDACLNCHASSAGPKLSECEACHAVIRAGVAPPSHAANWTRYHGTVVHARSEQKSDQCALCHQTSECTTCHHVQLPENHNNYWRRRGHGLTASMDRQSCMTCHDSDSCQRCHDEIRPLSHVGPWGAPQDRHCLACHEPLRGESCHVCHAATPSHDRATPLPPDHLPSMDCRLCHGNGQPLPHVDNGQTCTSCHR